MADATADQGTKIDVALAHYFLLRTKGTMEDLNAIFSPGMLVMHPEHPEWGTGQVQSNIGGKLTVNFRDEGKIVIDSARVSLRAVFDG
ncbi:hypothetical protein ROBYS_08390 [Roseobacter sp. OBYS 0001]|nr:hypothetical protein ROBYS_08390 [Roseobacter sp. OBYS 0001]